MATDNLTVSLLWNGCISSIIYSIWKFKYKSKNLNRCYISKRFSGTGLYFCCDGCSGSLRYFIFVHVKFLCHYLVFLFLTLYFPFLYFVHSHPLFFSLSYFFVNFLLSSLLSQQTNKILSAAWVMKFWTVTYNHALCSPVTTLHSKAFKYFALASAIQQWRYPLNKSLFCHPPRSMSHRRGSSFRCLQLL